MDAFLTKFDSDGNVVWATKFGGLRDDWGYSVAADAIGNCWAVASFIGPANFGGIVLNGHPMNGADGGGFYQSSVGILKCDSAGNVLWAKQESSGNEAPYAGTSKLSIAIDPSGNCFVSGWVVGRTFGAGPDFTNPSLFVSKYDTAGTRLWGKRIGDGQFSSFAGDYSANAITADSIGNCYVAGYFKRTAQFGTTNLASLGDRDIFIAKYDAGGVLLWVKQAGLAFEDAANGIALDNEGNLYVAGSFYDSATFGNTNVSGVLFDAFVAKLPPVAPIPPAILLNPVNQTAQVGGTAHFTISASGTLPLSYQWQFTGTNLVNETNAALTLLNVQPNEEGSYRMVVSNTGGAVTSAVATLTIVFPPSITGQPQSQIVIAGTEVDFGATTTGTLPLSYRWQFNGADITTGTNAALVIRNAQPTNGGNYTVIVTNAYGLVTSSVAALTVRYSLALNITGGGTVTRNPAFSNYPPNLPVTLTPTPGVGFVFNFWSGDASGSAVPLTITMTTNKSIAANFASTAVTVGIQGEGLVTKSADRPFYNVGEQVTLTAIPGRWFSFTHWVDGSTANPRVITIGANNNYTAVFSPTTDLETLTFSNVSRTAPVGMPAIFVDGEFVVANSVPRLDSAEVSMLTTFPNGSIFYTLDGSPPSFGESLYGGPFVLRRSATVRVVAYDASFFNSWEADPVAVAVEPTFVVNATTAGGGIVSISPTAASYRSNVLVAIRALPAPGWSFLQWLGDASGTNSTTSVRVVNRDLCAQALFGTTLGTTVAGGGSVVVDPAAALYAYGTMARLTAVAEPGNYFGAWGNAVMSTNNPLLFLVTNANPTVSCVFGLLSAAEFALTVLVNGRGTVTTTPRGNRFASGQSVRLTATADTDQEFLGWSGAVAGLLTNLTVALTQSKVITASFTKRPRLSLGPCEGGWREEGFQLTLTGEIGGRYRIERASELPTWSPLVSFTNTYGLWQMIDATAMNEATRFYRAVEEP